MKRSSHGIIKDEKAEDQPADKERAQTAHRTDPSNSVSREATREPKLTDAERKKDSGGARRH
jgi:hypothetical protein